MYYSYDGYPLPDWNRVHRIRFARDSISRAKMDLIRLTKFDSDCQYLVDALQRVQLEFRLKYAKDKESPCSNDRSKE